MCYVVEVLKLKNDYFAKKEELWGVERVRALTPWPPWFSESGIPVGALFRPGKTCY